MHPDHLAEVAAAEAALAAKAAAAEAIAEQNRKLLADARMLAQKANENRLASKKGKKKRRRKSKKLFAAQTIAGSEKKEGT